LISNADSPARPGEPPGFLVLAYPEDALALRTCMALESRHGPAAVRLISGAELAMAPRVVHRLDDRGASLVLGLADGSRLEPGPGTVVLNRLTHAAAPQFAGAAREDQEYASMETHALWLSMLASLPGPVINQPDAQGLAGRPVSRPGALLTAGKAGLPAARYLASTDTRRTPRRDLDSYPLALSGHNVVPGLAPLPPRLMGRTCALYLEPVVDPGVPVLVAGSRVASPLPAQLNPGLVELGRLLRLTLLEATFKRARADGGWRLWEVTSTPRRADPEAVAALVACLEELGP
jgi:hypothetical protein